MSQLKKQITALQKKVSTAKNKYAISNKIKSLKIKQSESQRQKDWNEFLSR